MTRVTRGSLFSASVPIVPRSLLASVLALVSTFVACEATRVAAPGPVLAASSASAGPVSPVASAPVAVVPVAQQPPAPAASTTSGVDAASTADTPAATLAPLPAGRVASAASLVATDLGIPRLPPADAALLVNVDALRATSVSSTLASIAAASSSLQEFVVHDPLRVAWVLLSGPSLDQTDRDVVILRCNVDDGVIDRWMDALSARSTGNATGNGPGSAAGGGPVPLTVPNVYAVAATLDHAARVVMRVQPHLVAIVPADVADDAAHTLVAASLPDRVEPREALRVRQHKNPAKTFPDLAAPGVTELRAWVEPGADASADGFLEEDAPTPAVATKGVEMIRAWVHERNSMSVGMMTGGILDHVDAGARGRLITAHIHATRQQVATILALVSAATGARPP